MREEAGSLAELRARNAFLERQLALHREALEHSHQGLCVYDENSTIVLCNRRYGEILRLPDGSIRPGISGLDVIRLGIEAGDYPADKTPQQIHDEIRARFHAGSTEAVPMVRDGHTYAVRRWTTPSGHLVSSCEDITARVEAEQALRDMSARLGAMLDAMPDCVKIFDEQARLVYINPKGLELLEAPDLETLNASGHVPLPPEHLPRAIEVHGRVMAGQPVVWDYEVLGMAGRRSHVEAHAVPFRMPDGSPAHMSITRDVTARKDADDALRRSEERLRLVHEATGLADFENGLTTLSTCSDRFFEQFGLPIGNNTIELDTWMALVHPEDRERLGEDMQAAVADPAVESFDSEYRILRADTGELRWMSCRTKLERDAVGNRIRTIGAHLDITDSKRAEDAVRESEERFRLAAEAAGLGIWDYDLVCDRREWSHRLREIFGFGEDVEPSLAAAEACIHPADRPAFKRTISGARAADVTRFECTFRIRRANDDTERWVAMNGWRTFKTDSKSRRIIMTVRDVTAEKTAEERVRWSAHHDQLTRLANRALFQERLEQAAELAGRTDGAFGVLLLDMDDFKQINDTLGHDAGDELLKGFAERLRSVVRRNDTVARFGGDEFAVIMPGLATAEQLTAVSNAIFERLREPFVHRGRLLDCRVSMGATLFPHHGTMPEELLKNADLALYAAKSAGRATLQFFEPQMRQDLHRRSTMVQLAREALSKDRVYAYYQPKLDLVTGALDGFEALLRWRRPGGRIEQPGSLEAAFEDLDVAAAISDRMIENTVADMRGWLERGTAFGHVAVNASAAEFRRDNFAERLLERLERAGVPTHCFQLEVTETVFLGRGAEYVHRALELLSAGGVKIALDDFGTGYASLRHLKQFPVDIIKIDRTFVRDMDSDPGDEAIVRAVVNLGQSLGIQVVAEGIESEWQAERLVQLKCHTGQGYLFSRAVPARRVPATVAGFAQRASPPCRSAA